MKTALLVSLTAVALAITSVWLWLPVVAVVAITINLGLAVFSLSRIQKLKKQELTYYEYGKEADKWLVSLMIIAMALFFTVTSLTSELNAGVVVSTIMASIAPIAFMLYLLLFPQHPEEGTIYDYFQPPKEKP